MAWIPQDGTALEQSGFVAAFRCGVHAMTALERCSSIFRRASSEEQRMRTPAMKAMCFATKELSPLTGLHDLLASNP
ncbi:hypothetical protein [Enorma phocaeensis]|uniref:Uncharacterized protein n=1 Tax=Enorma phocaeensis TaxID=1871019 RepID=A0ABT7VAW6_9ACTN|nr:hypothetical protein [Enorma phocaeensis]MDM8275640.1 hypothetical protein [Enorma phocaeensis]